MSPYQIFSISTPLFQLLSPGHAIAVPLFRGVRCMQGRFCSHHPLIKAGFRVKLKRIVAS